LGSLLWSRQIGTASSDESYSVAVDAVGNTYISGHTAGNLYGTSAGSWDVFVTKFDAGGSQLWSQQFGTALPDFSRSIAVDVIGNSYIGGYTYDGLAGSSDATLTKLDTTGNRLWSRQFGTAKEDYGLSVALDASGNTYISGYTYGSLDTTNAGGQDAFLTEIDHSGNVIWWRQIGTNGYDRSLSVAVDANGNSYISGRTEGDLGGTNAGAYDAFLTKFDTTGIQLWSRQIGTASDDESYSVAVDAAGNAYISGYTEGSLAVTNAGSADAYLSKYDASGNYLWSQQVGTASSDFSLSVTVDANANAYISGFTYGSLGGTNAGYIDAFLVKFAPIPEPSTILLACLAGPALLYRRPRCVDCIYPHPVRLNSRTANTSFAWSSSTSSGVTITTCSDSPSALVISRTRPSGPPDGCGAVSTNVATSPRFNPRSSRSRANATRS